MIRVSAEKWPYTHKVPKDPNAELDYQLDWSDWLAEGESINALDVTVDKFTLLASSFTTTTTTAWVSGGTIGVLSAIEFRITTDSVPLSRVDDRTLRIKIQER